MTLDRVQSHSLSRDPELPPNVKQLHRQLRNRLLAASNAGTLATSPADIYRHILILDEPPPVVREDLRLRDLHRDAYCVVGGEKNQGRDPALPHFRRDDGAWFDFSVVVRERNRKLELLAYDFEIRFPVGRGAPFMRFDLNLPDHKNEGRELRTHLHPGFEDLLVPAPLMSPDELLILIIDGLRQPTDRAPRALTKFEIDWYADTHASALRDAK